MEELSVCTMFIPPKPTEGSKWKGYVYNITAEKRVASISDVYHPHSLTIVNGVFWYCESTAQTVYCNGQPVLQLQNQGYLRGLAVTEHHIAVGVSSYRTTSRSTGMINNYADDGVPQQRCAVLVYDRKTHELVRETDFTATHQEVFSVHAVSVG